jgi:hypothetical protein
MSLCISRSRRPPAGRQPISEGRGSQMRPRCMLVRAYLQVALGLPRGYLERGLLHFLSVEPESLDSLSRHQSLS